MQFICCSISTKETMLFFNSLLLIYFKKIVKAESVLISLIEFTPKLFYCYQNTSQTWHPVALPAAH